MDLFIQNILVFDIETVLDIKLGKQIFDLQHLNDQDAFHAINLLYKQSNPNGKLLPLYLHQIIAISMVLKTNNQFKIWSLGDIKSNEEELLKRFFDGIDKFIPTLVSWNGTNFDLPVIHYRALKNQTTSPIFWETGKFNSDFKWNNYLNRYHDRHIDLMDIISKYSSRAFASLDDISIMLKLPGKLDLDGSKVAKMYLNNQIHEIRNYCEIDVLNTYLIYLSFELIRNNITSKDYEIKIEELKNYLLNSKESHFLNYLTKWNEASS